MNDFKDLNIKANNISKDGQRYFDVPTVTLMDILNQEVVIKDFETEVTTKNGIGRYAILIEFSGEDRKFITNNYKMKDILDQCKDSKLFPFKTTIRRKSNSGPKADYYFD
jgi:hypothetical protein